MVRWSNWPNRLRSSGTTSGPQYPVDLPIGSDRAPDTTPYYSHSRAALSIRACSSGRISDLPGTIQMGIHTANVQGSATTAQVDATERVQRAVDVRDGAVHTARGRNRVRVQRRRRRQVGRGTDRRQDDEHYRQHLGHRHHPDPANAIW